MGHRLTEPRLLEAAESIFQGVDIPFTQDEAAWQASCLAWKVRSAKAIQGLRELEIDIAHTLAIKDDALRDYGSLKALAALETRL